MSNRYRSAFQRIFQKFAATGWVDEWWFEEELLAIGRGENWIVVDLNALDEASIRW